MSYLVSDIESAWPLPVGSDEVPLILGFVDDTLLPQDNKSGSDTNPI